MDRWVDGWMDGWQDRGCSMPRSLSERAFCDRAGCTHGFRNVIQKCSKLPHSQWNDKRPWDQRPALADYRSWLTFKPVKINDKHAPFCVFFLQHTKCHRNLLFVRKINFKPTTAYTTWQREWLLLKLKSDNSDHPDKGGRMIRTSARAGQQSWSCKTSLQLSH